jgi:hypothetical protein
LYSRVVFGRVHVGGQVVHRSEGFEFRAADLRHGQHAAEIARAQTSRADLSQNGGPGVAAVARDERFHAAWRAHPGAVRAIGARHQFREQRGIEKRVIAGDDQDAVRAGQLERRINAANGSEPGDAVGDDGQTEVSEPIGVARDHEDVRGETLQDVQLSNDDGVTVDDEPALVQAAEPARLAPGKNRGSGSRQGHEWIMTEARIGRLVGASLHQAIFERLPDRLDFYEYWLNSQDLRDGRIDLAAMTAVMGFLRTEGGAYEDIMARAGTLAAEWSIASFPAVRRRAIAWLPRALRTRAAVAVAAGIVRTASSATRTSTRCSRTSATIELRASLFCAVREAQATPLCGFYLAAVVETLRRFDIGAGGRIERCHAIDGASCVIVLTLAGAAVVSDPAMAA